MGMKYLLDTNIISEPAKQEPSAAVLRRIRQHAGEMAIASITWHEMIHGAEKMPEGRKKEGIRAHSARARAILTVLPYDERAAEWHAIERARLRREGTPAPYADGQIAAIAAVNNLTLVTANVKDFSAFEGLEIEDWST